VVPIEAKAGSNKSKSLTEYIEKYHPRIAITTTPRKNMSDVVVHVPLYAAWKIPDIVRKREPPRS